MAFSQVFPFAEPPVPLAPAEPPVPREAVYYPARLHDLPAPPRSLWVRGRLPGASERLVAIVGARAATGGGCARARALAAGLAGHGFAVVSGGAFGIDAAAHQGALDVGAATFAVLGCGTDVVYPDRHADLFTRVIRSGGLLSEYPPGTQPRRGQFPARNRIIAALAEAVIVAEAAMRSGALITAKLARELGRMLLAVPGSSGTDGLVRVGHALPVESADDVLAALAGQISQKAPAVPAAGPHASLAQAIAQGANTAALLSHRLREPLPAILAALAEAELDGLVRRVDGASYEVIGHAN